MPKGLGGAIASGWHSVMPAALHLKLSFFVSQPFSSAKVVVDQSLALVLAEMAQAPGVLDARAAAVKAVGLELGAAPVLAESLAVWVLDSVHSFFPWLWWVNSRWWNEE